MEFPDRVLEPPSPGSSAAAVIWSARAQRQRLRERTGTRRSLLFPCPFFLGKGFRFAFFLLTDQRRPGFRFRIKGKLVRQVTISELEFNRAKLVVNFAPTELGIFSAEIGRASCSEREYSS